MSVADKAGTVIPGFTIGQPFNPYKRFFGILIPERLCKYRGLSVGAKFTWGRLARFAGKDGEIYPSVATLGAELSISAKQARRYVRELEGKAFIRPARTPGKSSQYELLWHSAFEGEIGAQRKQRRTTPEDGSITPPVNGSTTTPEDGTPEDGSLIESVLLRESSSRESIEESPSPCSKMVKLSPTAKESQNPKPFSSKVDDDEEPTPRTPLENPEMEFSARIMERHGSAVDVDRLLRIVKSELDCGPLSEFLEEDSQTTTAPSDIRNPGAYYRDLARKVMRGKKAAGLESVMSIHWQLPDVKFVPPCTCDDGKLPSGEYCDCGSGALRQQCDEYADRQANEILQPTNVKPAAVAP